MKSYLIALLSLLSLFLINKNKALDDALVQQKASNSAFMATQEYCIDLAVWHEARGEPEIGQYLVARTIINRAANAGTTPCEEVFKRNQYSFTSNIFMDNATKHGASVTHYHTKAVKPKWSKAFKRVAVVGDHVFYTSKNGTFVPLHK